MKFYFVQTGKILSIASVLYQLYFLFPMIQKAVSLASIRYNTDSNGHDRCWRLILDGEEILVESVQILVPVFTSRDWIESAGRFKHHISVRNCLVRVDEKGDAVITEASPQDSD